MLVATAPGWEQWLMLWTPEAVAKLGIPMILIIGLVLTCVRHGWPWRPKK